MNIINSDTIHKELEILGISKYDVALWLSKYEPSFIHEKINLAKRTDNIKDLTRFIQSALTNDWKDTSSPPSIPHVPPLWMRREDRLRELLHKQRAGNTSTGILSEREWDELNRYIPLTTEILGCCPSTTITNEQLNDMISRFHKDSQSIGR